MCIATFHTSPTCPHSWATLSQPCAPGRNFTTCPTFYNGIIRPKTQLRITLADPKSCPKCDKGDEYDGAQLRMVGKVVDGYRWGVAGPSEMAPGCDWAVSSRGDLIRRPRLKPKQPVRQVQCLCAIM